MSNKTRRRRMAKRAGRRPVPPPNPTAKPAVAEAEVAEIQDLDIQAVQARIEGQLTPQNRANVQRVVVAGMKAAMDGGANSIIAGIAHSKDPVRDSAVGAINLTMMLRKQSRDTMPVEALVPGASLLMLHALDFADRVGVIEVGRAEIDNATRIFLNHLFNLFHISPQKLNAMARGVTGVTGDAGRMDMIAKRAGVVKDPRASELTTLPQGLINGGGDA